MTFTNITRTGIYMQCCHREVEPGGTFSVPWERGQSDRGLRAAMSGGALVWKSDANEPFVPGSPDGVWSRIQASEARARREAEARARREAAELKERMAADESALKDNMARMGDFDVPKVGDYARKTQTVSREKPVTKADVITDDKPKSLADIRRHNRAVKMEHTSERKQA